MTRVRLVLSAGIGMLALVAAGCRKQEQQAFERPPAPVSVAAAESADVPVYLDEVGTCKALESVSIQAQVSGPITGIHFEDGADLKTGQLLFTIDPRPYQAALEAAEATLAQRKAVLEWTEIEYRRMQGLEGTKAVSQSDVDSKRNAMEVASAQVKQAEADISTAKINLGYCTIKSPIDGRAGHRLVDVGNVVSAANGMGSGSSLVLIQRLDPIYAEFTVTEDDLSEVQQSMAKGAPRVEVRLPDEGGAPITGTLTFVDNQVQSGTGTVRVRATIPNAGHRLWPGKFVKVRLLLGTLSNAVLIPGTAPQVSAKGLFVYVIKDDSTAELRPVTAGQKQGDRMVITQGLKAGERVVINGQLAVMPGGKVRVDNAPAAAASGEKKAGGGA